MILMFPLGGRGQAGAISNSTSHPGHSLLIVKAWQKRKKVRHGSFVVLAVLYEATNCENGDDYIEHSYPSARFNS